MNLKDQQNEWKPTSKRPKSVYKRKKLGHWEVDTVESGRNNHKRKSSYCLAKQLPNKKAETVTQTIIELLSELPKELKCDMCFSYPYCSWQRGTNENTYGLLREFYPKGLDLSLTNNMDLKEKLDLLNNRPRKCINYKLPIEVIYEAKCCT